MSAGGIASLVIVVVICGGGLVLLPRIWRGWYAEEFMFRGAVRVRGDVALLWWPFSEASRRGAIRGLVAAICAGWALLLGFTAMEVSIGSHGSVSHGARIAAWIFFTCFVLALVLHFTVMFFNWPKFIVPPPQRGERGILAERRGH